MKVIRVPRKKAESVKNHLLSHHLLNSEYCIERDNDFVYFPVLDECSQWTSVGRQLKKRNKIEKNLASVLKDILKDSEMDELITSYDIIGSILILDIPFRLEKKETLIAEHVLKIHPHITTILKKKGYHQGKFRTQQFIFLAGKDTRETEYKENGIRLLLNVETVYFSPRTANERLRVANLVQPNETIAVLFSGCGPYLFTIERHSQARKIIGIELNPAAHDFAMKNITINNSTRVECYQGDASKLLPQLKEHFNRIIMPLPKGADNFLCCVKKVILPATILHFYMFASDKNSAIGIMNTLLRENSIAGTITNTVECGQYSPRLRKYCLDIVIS